MPTAVDAHLTEPVPGVPVVSRLGNLLAVVHDGFPGVLLGVRDMGSDLAWIERCDVERPDEWQRVRSAGPVWLSAGGGSAYDLEAEYGRTYVYRLSVMDPTDFQVLVRMPDWGSTPHRFTGYLKGVSAPELSAPVMVAPPEAFTREAHVSSARGWGEAYPAAAWGGRGARTGSLTFHGLPGDDFEATEALLSSGVLLWQPRPDIRSRPMWILPGSLDDLHYGATPARRFTVRFTEVDRPAVTDVPPVVPGWTWDHAVAGRSFDQVDALYADEWSMLLDGVQRWELPRVGPS